MSWPSDARPGERALSRFTKWPGLEHWQREGVWLGTDEHGGLPADPIPVYVDLMWDVAWSPTERGVLTGIDMDLDVVRTETGATYLDDEDEFAEHSARWRYPDDVRTQVVACAERLVVDVRSRATPFDATTSAGWLECLAQLR